MSPVCLGGFGDFRWCLNGLVSDAGVVVTWFWCRFDRCGFVSFGILDWCVFWVLLFCYFAFVCFDCVWFGVCYWRFLILGL